MADPGFAWYAKDGLYNKEATDASAARERESHPSFKGQLLRWYESQQTELSFCYFFYTAENGLCDVEFLMC